MLLNTKQLVGILAALLLLHDSSYAAKPNILLILTDVHGHVVHDVLL